MLTLCSVIPAVERLPAFLSTQSRVYAARSFKAKEQGNTLVHLLLCMQFCRLCQFQSLQQQHARKIALTLLEVDIFRFDF